jgi:hypothetical protein
VTGGSASSAADKAKALVGTFIGQQAFVQAVDDVFLLAGITLVFALIPVLVLRAHHGRLGSKGMAVD